MALHEFFFTIEFYQGIEVELFLKFSQTRENCKFSEFLRKFLNIFLIFGTNIEEWLNHYVLSNSPILFSQFSFR